ncbi:hypothetical protein [Pleomorphovibrio marinus]|uniref:hypothetical protein n=1 Tax=Pleomorphovibrio marinus TaxID=2164132 RepID=UPI0013007E3A|nr:hypothetical protein [Pleomorphovibrio marinus]
MKNTKICICLFLLVACNQLETAEDPQPQAYLDEIEEIKKLYSHGLGLAMEIIEKESARHKHSEPYLMREHLVGEIVDVMARELMGLEEPIDDRFHIGFQNFPDAGNDARARMRDEVYNSGNYFTPNQSSLLNPFMDALDHSANPHTAKNVALSFQNQIIHSPSLNYEEKISLLSISSGTIVFSDFVLDGGIDRIKEKVVVDHFGQVQTLGCSVNTRNVFLAGVVGIGLGGTRGTIIGCTGGTVVFPGLGTAGGCVGGAVIGGALGFIEGVSAGIVAELMGSCFR